MIPKYVKFRKQKALNLGKVDLVMWTKNGAKTLPFVLEQIDRVVPNKSVNKRLIIDDNSIDDTREIAKSFGWQIFDNQGSGVSDGANTALRRVETEYFVSFEQDLLLAENWWLQIPSYLSKPNVAVANGTRLPGQEPAGLRKLKELELDRHFCPRYCEPDDYGKTLDNTIYKTKVIRDIGGFPCTKANSGVDMILANRLRKAGFLWLVTNKVQSLHIRGGLGDELHHLYWHGYDDVEAGNILRKEFGLKIPTGHDVMGGLVKSPAIGLIMAFQTREPRIIYLYPLRALYYFVGFSKASCKA
jgi:glycosyltransferase involved in cell wall biosynthesis